jgi:hypothetical protein
MEEQNDLTGLNEDQVENESHSNYSNNRTSAQSSFESEIHNLEELRRINNVEIQNLLRRVFTITERANSDLLELEHLLDSSGIYGVFINKKFFIFSFFFLVAMASFVYVSFMETIKNKEINISLLEDDDLWITYFFVFLFLVVFEWTLYLLFLYFFTGFENIKLKIFEIDSSDILFFNPFYFNLILFHLDRTYLKTTFDLSMVLNFSALFSINFIFSSIFFHFLKVKISAITNTSLFENKILIYKIRFYFVSMIFFNLVTSYIIMHFTENSDFTFCYLFYFKSIYTILKQIHMWYENEISYLQLDSSYATNEEYYKSYNRNKTFLEMTNQVIYKNLNF